MILQRIAAALKRQDWTTVVIEFGLVIAGVLIALQVNNLNIARLGNIEEQRYLVQLSADFETIEASAQDSVEFHRGALDGMTMVVKAINKGTIEPEERALFERGLRAAYVYQTSHDHSATLGEIFASGKISLFHDKELLRALMNYNAYLEQLEQGVSAIRSIQSEYTSAFTSTFDYDLSNTDDLVGATFVISKIGDYDIRAMSQDTAFRNAAIELRETQIYYLNWRLNILNHVQEIRRLLDDKDTP